MWKTLSFTNNYQVSSNGEIKSLLTNKILKPYIMPNGYSQISLRVDGATKKYYIHRIVAEHFIDNPNCKPEVNHINRVKSDNRVDNLEWVTPSENQIHKHTVKKDKTSDKRVGKFSTSGELLQIYPSVVEAARREGCAASSIYSVCRGVRKTLYGHIWKYLDEEIVHP